GAYEEYGTISAYFHSDNYPIFNYEFTPIDTVLDIADRRGYNVYIGMYERPGSLDDEIYNNTVTVSNELMSKYGTHPSFTGFYILQEPLLNEGEATGSLKIFRDVTTYLHTNFSSKKTAIAPYFIADASARLAANGGTQWWHDRTPAEMAYQAKRFAELTDIDLMLVQDSTCWDTTVAQISAYMFAIAPEVESTGCEFWTDMEMFAWANNYTEFVLAPISRIAGQIAAESSYKKVMFTFWYMDPDELGYYQQIDPARVQLYNNYTNAFIVPPTYVGHTGDFYPDGTVTFEDFALFVENWFKTGSSVAKYDLVNDGTVNFKDLAKFVENWLK
ncbi:MAG: DUF4434 domain-containing protein, partial [Phycisphaerales bacterium]